MYSAQAAAYPPGHPPGYSGVPPYEYMKTPPMSPSPGAHGYYSPRYSVHTATPSPRASPKMHARRASHAAPPMYTYTSPRNGGQFYEPAAAGNFSSPRYHTSSQRNPDYVSSFDDYYKFHSPPSAGAYFYHRFPQYAPKSRRYAFNTPRDAAKPSARHHRRRSSANAADDRKNQHRYMYSVFYDDDVFGGDYSYDDAPPPYKPRESYSYWDADRFGYYGQVPIYTEAEATPQRSRARRASHSARPSQPPPPKQRAAPAKPTQKATEEDARRAGIPAGYSYKNWDPTEEPILLLGSVFDANSLGKWIYDWTVFHFGAGEPMTDVAGELWLLLIQLSGKVKRAEECMSKIRKTENRELVEDFLESGERLWMRFNKLLKICEEYMWRAAKKETGEKKPAAMGKNSGREFVQSMFGRDRELEKTEKLMTGVRLWSMRFDANCDEILRFPAA